MSIRSLTFQVVAMVAIPAFAAYHESTAYDFTFSSFAREGAMTLRTEGEAKGKYTLGQELSRTITWPDKRTSTLEMPLFDKQVSLDALVGEGGLLAGEALRPISYVPNGLTVTAVSIVTPGDLAPETLTLTVGGTDYTLSRDDAETPETITLYGKDANGTVGTRSGTVHTYAAPKEGPAIVLEEGADASFSVAFPATDASGQQQNRAIYLLDGAPFLRLSGTAEITHHVFTINQTGTHQSLAALLEGESFDDDANTVVVVDFEGQGGAVDLDATIVSSPLIFGSAVEPEQAAIHFRGGATVTGPLTFRDGATRDGATRSGVSVYGPDATDDQPLVWDPAALLLLCDATLKTTLPTGENGWFATHATAIPAGRTFRIELEEKADANALPNLSFAAADSVLELALADNPQPPTKYTYLMEMQSGTLVFDQVVSLPSLTLGGKGLETTLILRAGQEGQDRTYTFAGSRQLAGIVTQGDGVTLIQEGGTLTLGNATRSYAPFSLNAEETVIEVRGGTMTCATALEAATEGTNTAITVAEGATLLLKGGLPAGAADTTATFDLSVAGTLQLNEDLAMTPALRRTLTLAGGTIESTRYYPDVVYVTCGDGGTADGEGLLDIVGGGTLTGSLVVDAAAGQGDLALGADTTLKTLRDFAGTVSGAGRLEAIEGTLGDVTLGDTWLANATGKKLGDVLTGWTENGTRYPGAADFAGTIGFTAGAEGAQKKLDFTNLDELTSLGMAFRINNHQHIVMRLDQYADAVIRWPDDPQGITLTLIESGAYGGELTLPHFPHVEGEETGVTFQFAYFNPDDPDGYGYTVREEGYTHSHSEDGVNDTLVWDNPVFTGEGAWIDIEFNGNTHNTGWFTLRDQNNENDLNGLLRGDGTDSSFADENGNVDENGDPRDNIMDNPANFTAVAHPADAQGGLALQYRPYVSFGSLDYPEEWSVAVRLTAPNQGKICLLALGNNTLVNANTTGTVNSIVFATGKSADEIVCYRFTGTDPDASGAIETLFRVTLPDIQDTAHIFSVVCEGRELRLYMDGAWLNSTTLPPGWNLGCGLQVGAQLGAKGTAGDPNSGVDPGFWDLALPADKDTSGGVIDYLRFYKGVLTDVAMVEMADRTPAVRENLRYVRYVPIDTAPDGFTKETPAGGETWIQSGAWLAETWDAEKKQWNPVDYADQPAEGAECRLLVAPGEHTIQVNVERQVTGETDGAGQPVLENHYFYSPNRNYAALVLAPQSGQTEAGTLRLTPLGVTAKEADDTGDADVEQPWAKQVIDSDWFKVPAPSTPGNRTGFRYGKLRFTGGASDPINDTDTIPNFYGAGYLLSGSGRNADTEATEETSDRVYSPAEPDWENATTTYAFRTNSSLSQSAVASGTATQTTTQTYTYTVTTTTPAGYTVAPINGIYDAGICYLSKHAPVVLRAAVGGGSTRVETYTGTRTWRRTADATRDTVGRSGWFFTHYEPADPPNERVTGTWRDATDEETDPVLANDTTTEGKSSQLNTLTMVAGRSLTRGETAEVMDWQLTGPVVVESTTDPGADPVAGHPALVEKDPANDQASLDVWVPFFLGTDAWKFYDDTRATAHGGEDNADGVTNGLFARGVQTPGRLYLDFTQGNKATEGLFSKQAWYRYGYEGEAATETVSGMAPIPATGTDFEQAVAFQIRLSSKTGDVTLTLDELPTARVQTFYVEEEAGATKALTLKLTRAKGVAPLVIWDTVVAAARLDVSNNNTGVASATSWKGNALNLRPAEGIRTPVHRGNATHGHGAYIVGATLVDWDFGAASSVPRLEVIPGAELTFTVGQDFRTHGTTVVAQGKGERTFPKETGDAGPTPSDLATAAWIHHMSDAPFLGQDVELGEGAIFGFHAEAASSNADVQNEGVVLSGELRLTGNATLRADYNNPDVEDPELRIPHFIAAGGIRATKPGVTLIVDAPSHQIADGNENHVNWHSHTSKMTGEEDFRLWKTGPGTVTFYASEPPSVTGKVTVEEGTLAVTTATDTPIGAKGLHVKKGATLADSGRMSGEARRLAIVPDGQTLSGGGTVAGRLGLKGGATYVAKQGEYLTADGGIFTDDSLEADITIDLPDGTSEGEAAYEEGTPYLIANRAERNVRLRLLPMVGEARWDSIAWIDTGTVTTTSYAARPPQFPAPTDYDGYEEGTSPATIGGILEDPLVSQYRNAGHAYVGATSGRTRAGNKALNNDELSDALLCFTNISAFVDDAGAADGRKYVDGTNFYVGYEFGVSQMAFAQVGGKDYVVLEVSVESALEESFPAVGFSEAQKAFVADFNGATVLSFEVLDAQGGAEPLDADIPVEPVTGMDGATPAGTGTAATTGKRWFRIPYQDLLNQVSDGNIRLRASASSPYAKRP